MFTFFIDNFSDNYYRLHGYLDAIYIYNASADPEKNDFTEPFNMLDEELYKTIDNTAICYNYIDYSTNKEAMTFKDIFEFEEANKRVSSNLKANSCYFNIIISTYKEALENVTKKGQQVYKDLTPERLCEILGIENKKQDLGLSIRTSLKFFEKFHIGLVVVNSHDDVIYKYKSDNNSHISPNTLYIMVYNSHC